MAFIYTLYTLIQKELLLLWRDSAGLAVLFLMPVILVVVVSLVQHNVLKTLYQPEIRMLAVNHDKGVVSDRLIELLDESSMIVLTKYTDPPIPDLKEALNKVTDGTHQFCLYIPEGISKQVVLESRQKGAKLLAAKIPETADAMQSKEPADILLYYDPMVQGAWRSAVEQIIRGASFAIETKEKFQVFFETMPGIIKTKLNEMSPEMAEIFDKIDIELPEKYEHENILTIDTRAALTGDSILPNAVQQNIPAWSLFGMFFIVVPLSGSLIRERQEGTLKRLFTLPVSFHTILMGKILAYMIICLIQFALMLLVGLVILPLQGLPGLNLGSSPAGLFIVALCAAFAATGFGLMVGAVSGSYEQGSMFGAVSVVIAAALGGVMLPVYVMPEVMQKISAFSPFSWGMTAFFELFVKGGDVRSVLPEALYLFLFGSGTMGIALWKMEGHKTP